MWPPDARLRAAAVQAVRRIVDWQKQGQNRHPKVRVRKSLTKSSSFSSRPIPDSVVCPCFLPSIQTFSCFVPATYEVLSGLCVYAFALYSARSLFIDLDRLIVMNAIVA